MDGKKCNRIPFSDCIMSIKSHTKFDFSNNEIKKNNYATKASASASASPSIHRFTQTKMKNRHKRAIHNSNDTVLFRAGYNISDERNCQRATKISTISALKHKQKHNCQVS